MERGKRMGATPCGPVGLEVRADDTDFHVYEIPVSEVMRDGERGGRDYREVEGVVDRVMSRVLTIKDEKGRGWTKYNVSAGAVRR